MDPLKAKIYQQLATKPSGDNRTCVHLAPSEWLPGTESMWIELPGRRGMHHYLCAACAAIYTDKAAEVAQAKRAEERMDALLTALRDISLSLKHLVAQGDKRELAGLVLSKDESKGSA